MNELGERDLRRRLATQDDPAFAPRISFRDLVATPSRAAPRSRRRHAVVVVLGLAAVLGVAVAAVAVRRPAVPSQPAATSTVAVTVTTTAEATTPTTTAADADADALATRLLTARNEAPVPSAATCHAASAAEREAARAIFGATRRPLFTCTLTLAGADVTYTVQVLKNGCFVSEPAQAAHKAPAILACGLKTTPGG